MKKLKIVLPLLTVVLAITAAFAFQSSKTEKEAAPIVKPMPVLKKVQSCEDNDLYWFMLASPTGQDICDHSTSIVNITSQYGVTFNINGLLRGNSTTAATATDCDEPVSDFICAVGYSEEDFVRIRENVYEFSPTATVKCCIYRDNP